MQAEIELPTLIMGLGNPGDAYARTRHNAGIWALYDFAAVVGLPMLGDGERSGGFRRGVIAGKTVGLLRSTGYMNESGRAIQAMQKKFGVTPGQCLVLHDDLTLPVGLCAFKVGGGHGGHNGLRDIIQRLGSNGFMRVRIGIGHPGDKAAVTDFVLSAPPASERRVLQAAISDLSRLLKSWYETEQFSSMEPIVTRVLQGKTQKLC